jgi:excisionase family DNA binding protein
MSLLKPVEAAKQLGIPPYRVYEAARDGLLPVVQVGLQVRIEESAVKKLIQQKPDALVRWRDE